MHLNKTSATIVGILVLASCNVLATPKITEFSARQRYPWNGMVDIVFKASGVEGPCSMTISASDSDKGTAYQVKTLTFNGEAIGDYPITSDGSYRFIWNAVKDVGALRIGRMKIDMTIVDLDLGGEPVRLRKDGPLFSKHNIGAINPQDAGLYFWWGDTVGHKFTYGSFSFSFEETNAPTYGKEITKLKSEGWIGDDCNLVLKHDAAHKHWGRNWRMPTGDEFQELMNNCILSRASVGGVSGYIVTGKGDYASSSIFLPYAGCGGNSDSASGKTRYGYGYSGYYWSSTAHRGWPPSYSKYLMFGSGTIMGMDGVYDSNYGNRRRVNGYPIRPVKEAGTSIVPVEAHTIDLSTEIKFDGRVDGVSTIELSQDDLKGFSVEYDVDWGASTGDAVKVLVNDVSQELNGLSGSLKLKLITNPTTLSHVTYVGDAIIETFRKTITYKMDLPNLIIDSMSWADFTLTLSWGKMTTGADVTVPCSLYRGTSDDIAQATCILKDSTATAYADAEFLDVQPRTTPLYYWVVSKGGDLSSASAPVKTRNRIGVFVGYDDYKERWQRPLRQALSDAAELRRICVEKGGFLSDNARLLSNSGARMQDIRDAFAKCAEVTSPGDMFVFYIATHGGGYSSSAPAYLCAYDAKYPVSSFLSDIRKFPSEVAVVAIIMACHSESMTGGASSADSVKSWVDNWLAQCGFAQCLGNVAWISSCASSESSYNSRDYSLFGQSFVCDGLKDGYADARLSGVSFDGVQYSGGNQDGVITFGELGRYAGAFATGLSDRHVSSVQLENESLLDLICIREGVTASPLGSPAVPAGVSASQGMFDQKILVSWDASETATGYRVYRYPTADPSSSEWVGSSFSCSYDDKKARVKEQYAYRIRAVNQVGLSGLSFASIGNRGSESYLSYLANLIGSASALVSASDYDAKEKSLAANGCRTVGECYATGVDPQDPNDDLKIEKFEIKDGKPVITLNHTKDGAGNSLESRIRMLGKEDLSDMEWVDITDKDKSPFRFFRMKVDLP